MIPEKFARKYRKYLNVRVCLKASKGEIWPIDLVGYGGELWLQNGWPEFASCYSLRFGHFLIFKYQGNSHFDVFIYDKSGIEIDYPFVSTLTVRDEQDSFNQARSTQVGKRTMIDINELKACKKTRANSACIEPCHIGDCWMRKLQHQKIEKVTSDKDLEVKLDDNAQPLGMIDQTKLELNLYNPMHQDRVTKGASAKDEQNSTALSKVSESSKPSFVLTVPSNQVMEMSDSAGKGRSFGKIMFSEICLHDKMMIPEKFVRKYGKQLHVGVGLKVPGGAVWHVDLVGDGDKVWLQNGWPKFARFYSVAFGHFLVFKYQGNSQFDVFIYDQRGVEVDYPVESSVHMNEQRNLDLGEFSQVRKRVPMDVDELKACKKTRANSACREACHVGECLIRKLQHKKALVSRLDGNIQPPEQGEIDIYTQQQGFDMHEMVLESSDNETDSSGEDMATQNGGTSATRRGLSGGFRMSTKSRLTKTMVIGLSAAAHEEKDRHASCSRNGSEAEAKAKGKRG
ncbi:hypothetical protein ACET3Z_013499 [Daucus carota]